MKILGIGVDIVENKRFKKAIKNKKLIKRLFTLSEIKNSSLIKDKSSFFSKKFAAKESFSKALGTGFRKNLNFKDIEIKNNKKGKPLISLNKSTLTFLKKKLNVKSFKINLSLSDEKIYSIAYVIIEKHD